MLYDGASITKQGLKLDRNPITQVKAAAKWLSDLLKESTGRDLPIRSVVVFPGWYIEPTAKAKASDVWVLNPKALPSFIAHSAERLRADEVAMCSLHLGRYVRTTPEN